MRGVRTPGTWLLAMALVTVTVRAMASPEGLDSPPFLCRLSAHNSSIKTVRALGKVRDVTFFWHDEPSRAAAALLMAAASAGGYTNLRLRKGPRDICHTDVAKDIQHRSAVAVAWVMDPKGDSGCHRRITSVSEAGAHSALRLHVRHSPASHSHCAYAASSWRFYEEPAALRECGFFNQSELTVYATETSHADVVQRCLNATSAPAPRTELLPRGRLAAKLRNSSNPVLFVDYNLWSQVPGVEAIHLPQRCYPEPNPGFRAVDEYIPTYAKDIHASLGNFNPEANHLLQVLQAAEEQGGGILQAACDWGQAHPSPFLSWMPSFKNEYTIAAFLCEGDPDLNTYAVLLNELQNLDNPKHYNVKIKKFTIDCTQPEDLRKAIDAFKRSNDYYTLIGVVADAGSTRDAVREAHDRQLPLVLVREAEALGEESARVAGGGAAHMANALRGVLRRAGWTRLALLADDTHATQVLRGHLADLVVKYVSTSGLDERGIEHNLRQLKLLDPRIMILSVEPTKGASLLRAAAAHNMTPAFGYAWVACGGPVPSAAVPHFAMSFWSRAAAASDEATEAKLRAAVSRHWARHSVPLADAVATLRRGFDHFYRDQPQYRNDLHTEDTIRLFWQSYDTSPAPGVNGLLQYENGTLREPRVHLEWCEGEGACRTVDEWRAGDWRELRPLFDGAYGTPPSDGAGACTLTAGDPYYPSCHDYAFAAIPLAVALVASTGVFVQRTYRNRLAKREAEVRQQLQQWKERAAGALAGYLVDRSALEVDGKLGEGRFGCVQFAVLRDRAAPPRPVAVKALREGAAAAEESDFLREASMLASLDHENVIRFIGVCAGDGPPLVLMEHAFFGDLLAYLRARRHLVEGAAVDDETSSSDTAARGRLGGEEAAHVSATALTRLAREAASALGYLASRGVVHRDVRASNCLVDARRTLKLSDFGLARQVGSDAAGDGAEYACRRRGFFPVLWMAPESLKHGVFSAASDVWSFGVLAVELVTLGARPYGNWSPLRVLQYVSDGGHPPLPLDATPQTRGLAVLCWRRRPEQRPSAAEVVAYLAANARTLRPALWRRADAEAADADSAFSESPSNEPDEPFGFASSPRSLPLP